MRSWWPGVSVARVVMTTGGVTGVWPVIGRVRQRRCWAVGVAAVVREVAGITTAETEDYSVIKYLHAFTWRTCTHWHTCNG